MHKLCDNKDPGSSEFMVDTVKCLFKTANEGLKESTNYIRSVQKFAIPFLYDKNG